MCRCWRECLRQQRRLKVASASVELLAGFGFFHAGVSGRGRVEVECSPLTSKLHMVRWAPLASGPVAKALVEFFSQRPQWAIPPHVLTPQARRVAQQARLQELEFVY